MAKVGDMDILNPIDYGHPLARGLVGCWIAPGAKAGGNKLYDLSPYRNHGVLEASMTPSDWVPAQHGRGFGLDFDGSDDYIDVGSGLQDFSSISIFALFKTSTTSNDNIVESRDGTADGYLLHVNGSALGGDLLGKVNDTSVTSGTNYNDGIWHHGGFCWDGAEISLWADGICKDVDSVGGTIGTSVNMLIAGVTAGGNDEFDGTVADVMIWSRALSPAEVRQLYIAGLTGDYPFLRSRMPYELWPRAAGYAPPPHIFQPIGALS